MNRTEKRQFKKTLQKASRRYDKNARQAISGMVSSNNNVRRVDLSIPEGAKVKFRIDKMRAHPDWFRLEERYRKFVEDNVDTIFTVQYDALYPKEPLWVCLAEDPSPIKWLFYIGDLKQITE